MSDHYVISDNGLWLASNHAVAVAARTLKIPRVVSPRGMLTTWALNHGRLKKRIAWWLYQRRDMNSATALHATSEQEAVDCRRAKFLGPIAVVPNGIDLPAVGMRTSSDSPRTVVCLARLHPIKGLRNLVEAWANLRPAGWRVRIAGNDVNGHEAELRAVVSAHGLNDSVEFLGPIEASKKWDFYRNADLFVLPSNSENFGLAIAEALASGIPVITTYGTPWRDLITYRCGWWVEIGVASLVDALREATSVSDNERRTMGERGRKLIEEKYSWAKVAGEMLSVYAWLLGQQDRPACVNSESTLLK